MQARYEKIVIFDQNLALYRKWCKNANRKPYQSFRMVPVSMTLSDLFFRFQGHDIIQRQTTRKWYLYNGRSIVSRIWSIERRHIQRSWTISNQDFTVTLLFDDEYLRNGTSGILIRTCIPHAQGCHFEWPWVTLSDFFLSLLGWNTLPLRASAEACLTGWPIAQPQGRD